MSRKGQHGLVLAKLKQIAYQIDSLTGSICKYLFNRFSTLGNGHYVFKDGLSSGMEFQILLFFIGMGSGTSNFQRICDQDIVIFHRDGEDGFLLGFESESDFIEWANSPFNTSPELACQYCGDETDDIGWGPGSGNMLLTTEVGNLTEICMGCRSDLIKSVVHSTEVDTSKLVVSFI